MASVETSDPRELLANALSLYLTPEQLGKLIDEVLSIEKRVAVESTCRHCRKSQKVWTSVPDAKAVALALPDLLNQAFGRPGEATGDNQNIVFNRWTKLEDAGVG